MAAFVSFMEHQSVNNLEGWRERCCMLCVLRLVFDQKGIKIEVCGDIEFVWSPLCSFASGLGFETRTACPGSHGDVRTVQMRGTCLKAGP